MFLIVNEGKAVTPFPLRTYLQAVFKQLLADGSKCILRVR